MKLHIKETNTFPPIIHGNGKSKRDSLYKSIEAKFISNHANANSIASDLTIVSWKGGKYKGIDTILEKCMRGYGQDLTILDWPNNTNFWEGSKYKITGTLNYLKSVSTKYFMWFDASDVILLQSPLEILKIYKDKFSGKLVFNAERNHYPKENRQGGWSNNLKSQYKSLELYDNTFPTTFKYMNTGCCVGETKIAIRFLEKCMDWIGERINDTVAGRLAQREMESDVVVDRGCDLFVCLYNVNETEVEII